MSKTHLAIFLCLCTSLFAENKFSNSEFSIDSLPFNPILPGQVMSMMLPAHGGFAPNVNVQKQPFKDTLEAYGKISLSQFEKMKMILTSSKYEKNKLTLEYHGLISGRRLTFYAAAHKKGNFIYLTTATCPTAQWTRLKHKLRACVDSFALK